MAMTEDDYPHYDHAFTKAFEREHASMKIVLHKGRQRANLLMGIGAVLLAAAATLGVGALLLATPAAITAAAVAGSISAIGGLLAGSAGFQLKRKISAAENMAAAPEEPSALHSAEPAPQPEVGIPEMEPWAKKLETQRTAGSSRSR